MEVKFFSSNEIDLVSQTCRFWIPKIPVHKQHTLGRNVLARVELVYILLGDLVRVQIYRKSKLISDTEHNYNGKDRNDLLGTYLQLKGECMVLFSSLLLFFPHFQECPDEFFCAQI